MHANGFDTLARRIGSRASRRVAIGLAATGLLGIAAPEAEALRCSKWKPCPLCYRCRNQRCKPKKNGSTCGYNQVCEETVCTFCINDPCTSNADCCTDYCFETGQCKCWAGNQRPSPSGCTSNPQCCNGACNIKTGTCACDPNGSPCFFTGSCCSGKCVGDVCQA